MCCSCTSLLSKHGTYDAASDLPRERASSANCRGGTLRRCRQLLFLGLVLLPGACALLLPIASFIVVPFFIDTDTLAHKYDFEPMKASAFIGWRVALLTLVPLFTPVIITSFVVGKHCRLLLLLPIVAFATMLVVGNVLSALRTDSRLAYRSEFAVKFNRYYCDARTLRVCLDSKNDPHELVLLTRGNLTAAVGAVIATPSVSSAGVLGSETPTTAALAIWKRCKFVILEAMARETARDNEPEEAAEMEIETGKIYRFVDDNGVSRATDAWCGSLVTRATPFTDAEHQTLPSPFAKHPEMYASYTREWSRRMDYSNALLAPALGCLAITTFLLSYYDPPR